MTTEERLEKLECELARARRGNRRLLLAGTGLLLGLLALLVLGQLMTITVYGQENVPDKTVIRANEFVLLDEQGRERGRLDTLMDYASLSLYDRQGNRVQLGPSGFDLWYVDDEKVKSRAKLIENKEGATLSLYDPTGEMRIFLGMFKDGPSLSLWDKKDEIRASLEVAKEGPKLTLYDAKDNGRALFGAAQVKNNARHRSESSLLFFGPDGKLTWQAP